MGYDTRHLTPALIHRKDQPKSPAGRDRETSASGDRTSACPQARPSSPSTSVRLFDRSSGKRFEIQSTSPVATSGHIAQPTTSTPIPSFPPRTPGSSTPQRPKAAPPSPSALSISRPLPNSIRKPVSTCTHFRENRKGIRRAAHIGCSARLRGSADAKRPWSAEAPGGTTRASALGPGCMGTAKAQGPFVPHSPCALQGRYRGSPHSPSEASSPASSAGGVSAFIASSSGVSSASEALARASCSSLISC